MQQQQAHARCSTASPWRVCPRSKALRASCQNGCKQTDSLVAYPRPSARLPAHAPVQVIISQTDGASLVDALSHSKTVQVKLSEVDADEVKLWDHANLYVSSTAGADYTVSLKDVSYKTAQGSAKGYAPELHTRARTHTHTYLRDC